MKKIGVIIVVIAIVVGAAILLFGNKRSTSSSSSSSTTTPRSSSNTAQPASPAAATITYSNSGFSPTTITVKSGDTVAIKNTSNQDLQFDSDPHPVHTDDTDLNVGTVAPDQSTTFTVTKKCSFGYHNHLNPIDRGNIVIQ